MADHTIVLSFYSLGGYHFARLNAVVKSLGENWRVCVIELSATDAERPWGTHSSDSVEVRTLFDSPETLSAAGIFELRAKIDRLLTELNPDVVCVPGWGHTPAWLIQFWAWQNRRPMIMMSESKADDKSRHAFKEWAKGLLVSLCDAGLVGGEKHAAYLTELGMPATRISTGYDVVDNQHFTQGADAARNNPEKAKANLNVEVKQPFLLAATRFIPRKNLLRLMDAYAEYRERVDDPMGLVLLGSGEQQQELEAKILELGLSSAVDLPGFVGYEQMPSLYGFSEAFIHPALTEQWGLVINEACAAGVPVLASNTIGSAEMVEEGRNGFLFDPESQREITEVLIRFHELSAPEKQRMSKEAVVISERYDPLSFGQGVRQCLDWIRIDRKLELKI